MDRKRGTGKRPTGHDPLLVESESEVKGKPDTVGRMSTTTASKNKPSRRDSLSPSTKPGIYWLLLASTAIGFCISVPSTVGSREILRYFGFDTKWTAAMAALSQMPFGFKFLYGYILDTMPVGGYKISGHAHASGIGAVIASLALLMGVEGGRRIDSSVSFFDFSILTAFCYVFFSICTSVIDACILYSTKKDSEESENLRNAFQSNHAEGIRLASDRVQCGATTRKSRSVIPSATWLARDAGAFLGFVVCSVWNFSSHPAPFVMCWVMALAYAFCIHMHLKSENKVADLSSFRTGMFRTELFFDYFQNSSLGIVPVLAVYMLLSAVPRATTVVNFLIAKVDRAVEYHTGASRIGMLLQYIGNVAGVAFYVFVVIPSFRKRNYGKGEDAPRRNYHESEPCVGGSGDEAAIKHGERAHGDAVSDKWPRAVHLELVLCITIHIISICGLAAASSTMDGSDTATKVSMGAVSLFVYGFAERLVFMPLYDYCFQICAPVGVRNTAMGIISSATNFSVFISYIIGDTIASAMRLDEDITMSTLYFVVIIGFDLFLCMACLMASICESTRKEVVSSEAGDSTSVVDCDAEYGMQDSLVSSNGHELHVSIDGDGDGDRDRDGDREDEDEDDGDEGGLVTRSKVTSV